MSNICTNDDPCFCIDSVKSPKSPPVCPSDSPDCCLKACNALIDCDGAVGPCGMVGVTDLSTIEHNTSGCGVDPVFRLNDYDRDVFLSVSLKTNGELTWITNDKDSVGKFGEISFKVICISSEDCGDCTELRSNGIIRIGVKDLCLGNSCEECDYCDPCSGECVPKDINIKSENS